MSFEEFSLALEKVAQRFMVVRILRNAQGSSEEPTFKEAIDMQQIAAEKGFQALCQEWKEVPKISS